jgi:holliday junction DNA helicase RuvA
MIGYLQGRIIARLDGQVVVKTASGIGYVVHVSPVKGFMINENVEFFIWHVKRENDEDLYSFDHVDDRKWAEKLTKVSGVGPKAATNIIYSIGAERVAEAIANQDSNIFASVKGLGEKTAKKIVLELKGATTDLARLEENATTTKLDKTGKFVTDFTDTLSNLGYKRGEIVSMISSLKRSGEWEERDLTGMVKKALSSSVRS